jgi:cytochrome P450
VLDGVTVPAGTRVSVSVYMLHHNPDVYEDPESFRPDRFHPDKKDREPFSFVPFSAGPR